MPVVPWATLLPGVEGGVPQPVQEHGMPAGQGSVVAPGPVPIEQPALLRRPAAATQLAANQLPELLTGAHAPRVEEQMQHVVDGELPGSSGVPVDDSLNRRAARREEKVPEPVVAVYPARDERPASHRAMQLGPQPLEPGCEPRVAARTVP